MHIIIKGLAVFSLALLLVRCGTPSKVSTTDLIKSELQAENYQAVYDQCKALIDKNKAKNKPSSADLLQMAGIAALKLDKQADGRKYLEEAVLINPNNESIYPTLVQLYRDIDNLSMEITTYENYFKVFPEGEQKSLMQNGFFDAYIRSENWQPAFDLYHSFSKEKMDKEKNLEGYLMVCQKLGKLDEANNTVDQLLAVNPQNALALSSKAFRLYNSAETRYNKEMSKYNKNKTRKQYAILLKALETSTAEFKAARDIYEPLYKSKPSKEVAKYLSNIYARLNDKKKSAHYKALSK